MTDLDQLIRDIEAAPGPSHDLDKRVALAIGWNHKCTGEVDWWKGLDGDWHLSPPKFTASLDVARTTFGAWLDYHIAHGAGRIYAQIYDGPDIRAQALTEINALLAASLKLRRPS